MAEERRSREGRRERCEVKQSRGDEMGEESWEGGVTTKNAPTKAEGKQQEVAPGFGAWEGGGG